MKYTGIGYPAEAPEEGMLAGIDGRMCLYFNGTWIPLSEMMEWIDVYNKEGQKIGSVCGSTFKTCEELERDQESLEEWYRLLQK